MGGFGGLWVGGSWCGVLEGFGVWFNTMGNPDSGLWMGLGGCEAHPERGWGPATPNILEGSTSGRSPTGGDAPHGGPPVLTPLSSAEGHPPLTLRDTGSSSTALRRPPLHPAAFSGGSLPTSGRTQGLGAPHPTACAPQFPPAGCLNCSRVGELTARLATLEAQASPNLGFGHVPLHPPRGTRALGGVTLCPLLSPTPAVSSPGGPAGGGRAPQPSSTQRQQPGQGTRGPAALGVPGRPREPRG